MENQVYKNPVGMSVEQLENGTPSDKKIILKAFYKDDKCTISPAKDINGRYKGIKENIPEIKKLEMGYVPGPESKVKIYDGIEIDLNDPNWAKDWEWMKHCQEIADTFASGQATRGAYFYVFRPGIESAKKVREQAERVKLYNYILNDSAENLYNRAAILGNDMSDSVISDVKEFLLDMVASDPAKIQQVYESKTFSLELLMLHAIKRGIISKRNGVFTFGEILLGVDEKAVVSFFANPKNQSTTRAVEAMTYGEEKPKNPLENEVVQAPDLDEELSAAAQEQYSGHEDGIKASTLEEDFANSEEKLTPQQKAARTRAANKAKRNKK